ncbi:Pentatricopeptide repeat-containing protein, mitochondrial [Ananas comosus]|uniref:Pentatricopeptide repeat-containing protein, mitochondrial n=1 Tax=Ananas comosus TaxID=4615 RepID=A0A199W7E9_ANACO|nr:Pentatricopeptide repeat-containing protein, mitochondrial [Ananas comosus]
MPRSAPARISARVVSLLRSSSSATKPYPHLLQIHALMVKSALDLLPFPTSLLLSAAAAAAAGGAAADSASAAFIYARAIFRFIPAPNLFQYNTILRSYAALAHRHHPLLLSEALALFKTLMTEPLPLDQFPFVSVLKLSAQCRALPFGKQVHGLVAKSGFDVYPNVWNTLIHFYCCCGEMCDAHTTFDEMPQRRDVVSWAALINGYVQVSETKKAMSLFRDVVSSCLEVNAASIVSALSASVEFGSLCGECLHGYCIKIGFCSELNVATAIMSVYVKFGCMDYARKVFDSVQRRDLVLYNCMVCGYAKEGLVEESLGLIEKMRRERVKPNSSTFVGLLSACASSGALVIGRRIHEFVKEEDIELDSALGTALVDMYSKTGCIIDANKVFDEMPERDVKAWTAMIMGFGFHGRAEAALSLFYRMESEKALPNEVTFLAVLSACSHGGLAAEAKKCFEKMVRDYKLSPKPEHYGCVIDLLGRAGRLEEAHELIKGLPSEADAMAWRALLAACRVHGNVELGETVRRYLVGLGDEHPADSVVLSSTYAGAGMWDAIAKAREFEGHKMVKKEAGCSSIEMAC